jgi:hypothetical protein
MLCCIFKTVAGLKRELTVPDLAIIAELNLCSGLCMLGRWSHGHAAIKRCTWIKRTDGVSLQHLKRVVSKYMLILQRTTSILKVSTLEDRSVLGVSVWPLIHGRSSSNTSPSMSPNLQPLRHPSLSSSMEEMRLSSPSLDRRSSTSPGSSFSSPHLAGKLRPGSAGLLRPVSAMSAMSHASNFTVETQGSTVMLLFTRFTRFIAQAHHFALLPLTNSRCHLQTQAGHQAQHWPSHTLFA